MVKGAKLSSWPLPQCSYKRRKQIHFAFTNTNSIIQEIIRSVAVASHSSSAKPFECIFLIYILSLFQLIMKIKIVPYCITCF